VNPRECDGGASNGSRRRGIRGAQGDLGGLRKRPGGVWVLHADDKVQRDPLFGLAPHAVSRHGRAGAGAGAGAGLGLGAGARARRDLGE
jgi:hypothetical protein